MNEKTKKFLKVLMFCDASSEGYGGYLEFGNHNTSEGKLSVMKDKGIYLYSKDVGKSGQCYVFSDM